MEHRCRQGSGGLWNNSQGAPGKNPMVLADRPFGEWNSFRIIQAKDYTTVFLNDQLVVDHAKMENFWDRSNPLWDKGPIQLQTHGGEIRWRNLFIREIPDREVKQMLAEPGFKPIFNGHNLDGWAGPVENYEVKEGAIVCKPNNGGTIYYHQNLTDFVARLEFKLPPGGNNGLAIRYPGQGDTAYSGMCELQVLDNSAEKYAKLDARQYHGSAYGMVAAKRGHQKAVGEWNEQEVTVQGSKIKVVLNGTTILDTDLREVREYMGGSLIPARNATMDFLVLQGTVTSVIPQHSHQGPEITQAARINWQHASLSPEGLGFFIPTNPMKDLKGRCTQLPIGRIVHRSGCFFDRTSLLRCDRMPSKLA